MTREGSYRSYVGDTPARSVSICDVEGETFTSPVNYNYVISLLVCAVRFCELRPRAPSREDLRQRNVGDDKVGNR